MFRTKSILRLCTMAAGLAALAALGSPAAAQSSFEDGSFSAAEAADQSSGGGWPAAPETGFGGSFEPEGEAAGADRTPAEEAAEGGFGGNFEGQEEATVPEGEAETTEGTPPASTESETAAEAVNEADTQSEAETHEEVAAADADGSVSPDSSAIVDPQILAFELRNYGVPPSPWLRPGQFHAATPTVLPGGFVITTQELVNALASRNQPFIIVDVLGGEYALPNAFTAPGLAAPGNYADRTQQQAMIWLAQVTGGNPTLPIVMYCSDPMCWLSYNAALRAIAAGYSNVYWYRGGLQAWQMAGLPVVPSGL